MRNYSYENDFDLHENETGCRTHFHMKGLAFSLVLKQRHKITRKWPIFFIEVCPLEKSDSLGTKSRPQTVMGLFGDAGQNKQGGIYCGMSWRGIVVVTARF